MSTAADARDALLAASLAFAEGVGAPDVDGVSARVLARVRLLLAADAYGVAVMRERERAHAASKGST
jgi:hypothetical protein